ncbi:MAG: hydrogen peroxide-inducible genes activator [Bacteroidales bacterium]|nr:hydrogen peroxide-inducible genes activator [Bacteroidales bacterium]
MTLQQLEYIVAVCRMRHFARAAEQCGVTQPTLSAMVQKLEAELGLKLFERSSQQVTPTRIGLRVVEQAEEVLAAAARVKELVDEERHSLAGTFRLGVLPTIAPYLLPRFFPRLRKEHPETDLRVTELKTADICRALREGTLDAAVLVSLPDMEDYEQVPLYYEQFIVYVSREDPLFACRSVRTADLEDEQLWLLDEGHCFRDQLVKFCRLKSAREAQEAYTLGSIETFMRMVEGGQGVTFIPELALEQLSGVQKELVRPFALPIPTRQIVLMTSRDFVRHSLRDLLVENIVRCVPPRMLKLNNTEQRV